MATRSKGYKAGVVEHAREAILDLPVLNFLAYRSAEQIVQDFTESWGMSPKAVVIPVLASDGVYFDNPCELPLSRAVDPDVQQARAPIVDFAKAVYDFGEQGLDIYLLVAPSVSFVSANPLLVVDSVGDTARLTCMTKNGCRELISEIVAEAVLLATDALASLTMENTPRLRGLVFDVVNIWPMSSTNGRIELNCFCEDCVAVLERHMKGSTRSRTYWAISGPIPARPTCCCPRTRAASSTSSAWCRR